VAKRLIIGTVVLGTLAYLLSGLPLTTCILTTVDVVRGAGALGVVLFALAAVVMGAFVLPASWPQMASGFLYGPAWGFLLAWALAVVSAWVNATLGHRLFRERVRAIQQERGGLAAKLDERLAERGTSLVVLLRLPPVLPFHPISYALGATRVSMGSVVLGTAIGGIAPVALHSFLGASVTELAVLLEGGTPDAGPVFWVTGALTILAVAAVTVRVRQELVQLA
jgi:uncharacterized membrane protein YdjX (TVP38/TMEM64 family)